MTTEAYGVIHRKPAPAKPALAKAGGGGRSDRLPASGGKAIRRRRINAAEPVPAKAGMMP